NRDNKMIDIQKTYNEIFIPGSDVLNLAGSSTFSNLESKTSTKNLILIPISLIEELQAPNSYIGLGGEDVLMFLKGLPDPQRVSSNGKTVHFYEASDHLNIGVILSESDFGTIDDVITSLGLKSKSEKPVILTNDPTVHLKFKRESIDVQSPKFLMVNQGIVNEGIVDGNDELSAAIQEQSGKLPLDAVLKILDRDTLYRNQFIRLTNPIKPDREQFLRVTSDLDWNKTGDRIVGERNKRVVTLGHDEYGRNFSAFGISPLDMEQYLALKYAILNREVSLGFIAGSQGSGKTLLSYIGAVKQIVYDGGKDLAPYKQILLFKPNELIGGSRRDVGFLPGSLYEKLKPHLAPYEDSHNESELSLFSFEQMLRHPKHDNDFGAKRETQGLDNALLPDTNAAVEIVFSGFLRGRSFRNCIALIDEAQNFTPYEVKTIIQRLGEGCKAIIMGDPYQTDNPFCSREINGLTHAINHYIDRPYTALVKLSRNYRSQMSKESDTWRVFGT
ncbi:MAG: PhoH family protein, partial [archaeon]